MIKDIREIKECPDCASTNIVYGVRDQVICRDCGLIYEPLAPALEERFEITHGLAPPRPKTAVTVRKTARKKPKKKAAKKKSKKKAAKRKPARKKASKKKKR